MTLMCMQRLWEPWCTSRLFLAGALLLLGSSCESTCLVELSGPGNGFPNGSSIASRPKEEEGFCLGEQPISTAYLVYLRTKVTNGDPQAARCLVANLHLLDGGELEDSLIALGEFSKHQMAYFLSLRKENLISRVSFENALTMLPLAMTENPKSSLTELAIRKTAVLEVDGRDLIVQKRAALEALERFSDEIKSK